MSKNPYFTNSCLPDSILVSEIKREGRQDVGGRWKESNGGCAHLCHVRLSGRTIAKGGVRDNGHIERSKRREKPQSLSSWAGNAANSDCLVSKHLRFVLAVASCLLDSRSVFRPNETEAKRSWRGDEPTTSPDAVSSVAARPIFARKINRISR